MIMNKGYWSDLPSDILHIIMGRLNLLERVFFGAVCKNWQSASASCPESFLLRAPWQMISKPVYHSGYDLCIREFTNFSTNEKFTLEFRGIHFCSRNGWILLGKTEKYLTRESHSGGKHPIFLLNLLTGSKLKMPCYTPRFISSHGTFSTSRHCNNVPHCVVLASERSDGVITLSIAHPGDDKWMEFHYPIQPDQSFAINSLFMTGGHVYCINVMGDVLVFDLANYKWTSCMPPNRWLLRELNLPYFVVTNKEEIIKVQAERNSSWFHFSKLNEAKTAWVELNRTDQLIKGKTWYLCRRNSWVTTTGPSEIDKVYEIKVMYTDGWSVTTKILEDNSLPKILQVIEKDCSDGIGEVDEIDWVDLG